MNKSKIHFLVFVFIISTLSLPTIAGDPANDIQACDTAGLYGEKTIHRSTIPGIDVGSIVSVTPEELRISDHATADFSCNSTLNANEPFIYGNIQIGGCRHGLSLERDAQPGSIVLWIGMHDRSDSECSNHVWDETGHSHDSSARFHGGRAHGVN